MPYYASPKNDEARLTFVSAALETSKADRAASGSAVSIETETALAAFVPLFKAAYDALSGTKTVRSREARQRREAMAALETMLLDMWEGVRRRARRLGHSVEVLTYYGLPMDGTNVRPTSPDGWVALSGRAIHGDAEAVAAGYPPICNPTAAELQTAMDSAKMETTEARQADRVYDQAQADLAVLREEANKWIEEVMADLRYNLRRLDSESQRRIMRTFGATFAYLQGEAVDADDQPEGEAVSAEPVTA